MITVGDHLVGYEASSSRYVVSTLSIESIAINMWHGIVMWISKNTSAYGGTYEHAQARTRKVAHT